MGGGRLFSDPLEGGCADPADDFPEQPHSLAHRRRGGPRRDLDKRLKGGDWIAVPGKGLALKKYGSRIGRLGRFEKGHVLPGGLDGLVGLA